MTGYTDTIRRYATDTRFVGTLENADGTGEVGLGADEAGRKLAVRFTLRLVRERVADVRFQVFGCGFTIAACAAAAEMAQGRPLADVAALDPETVDAALGGLPAERGYCAELAAEALQAALQSARSASHAPEQVSHDLSGETHGPRVSAADPLYRLLSASPAPEGGAAEDRHLFACLLAVVAGEPWPLAAGLGLDERDLAALLQRYFPGIAPDSLETGRPRGGQVPPPINPEVLGVLRSHLTPQSDAAAQWLTRILAARAAHPGHLWVAMGFFERPELSAAIRRHLPSLSSANNRGMRWKRYLFKQVCDLHGARLCKTPDCGTCSDYALCFAPED